MPLAVDVTDLIAYTDWQRGKWHAFLRQHEDALQSSAGPNGDGRFTTIGDLVKHISLLKSATLIASPTVRSPIQRPFQTMM